MSAIHDLIREQFEIEESLPALRAEAKKAAKESERAHNKSAGAAMKVYNAEQKLISGEAILLKLVEREGWHVQDLNRLRAQMKEAKNV